MKLHTFRNCHVREWPDAHYLETVFNDGTKVPAAPSNLEQRLTAVTIGYGDDVWRMVREHELLHTFLAEWIGLPHSLTLWAVAHPGAADNASVDFQKREESIVLAVQKLLNTYPEVSAEDVAPLAQMTYEARRMLAR